MTTRRIALLAILLAACAPHLLLAQWIRTGGPYDGGVYSLAGNGAYLFAGIPEGGIYRSSDNGAHWSEALINHSVISLAANGSTIFAGTDRDLYRSTDNGDSWNLVTYADIPTINRHTVAVIDGEVLVGTSNNWLFRSTDNGETWSMLNSGLKNRYVGFIGAGLNGDLFLDDNSHNIYRSDNRGMTWQKIDMGNPYAAMISLVAIDTVLVAGSGNGIYRSVDSGNSWVRVDSVLLTKPVNALVDIGNTILAATNNGLYSSTDHGASWHFDTTQLLNQALIAMIQNNGDLFAVKEEGIYRSTDGGANWSQMNTGLNVSNVTAVAVSGEALYASARIRFKDRFRISRSIDSGTTWTMSSYSILRSVNCLAAHGSAIFAGVSRSGLFRSTDSGTSWMPASNGLVGYSLDTTVYDLAANDTYIYAGLDDGIYRSSDGGLTWESMNAGIRQPGSDAPVVVSGIVARPSDLFIKTLTGIFRSTDNGTSWSAVNEGLPSPDLDPYSIHLLAATTTAVIVLINDTLYRTIDNGAHWRRLAFELPLANFRRIAAAGNDFYLSLPGTGYRNGSVLLRSTNNGETWMPFDEGLDSTYVAGIAATAGTLYAATSGKGVWRRPIPENSADVRHDLPGTLSNISLRLYPNPAITESLLSCTLHTRTSVTITIHDALGRVIAQPVVDAVKEAGEHQTVIDTKGMAAGIYVCNVNAGGVESTVRFVVVR